jgi:uncharacterized membrane protein
LVQSSPRPDQPLGDRLQQDLKNDLIAGLLVVIPLATTIWLATTVSRFVLAFLTSIPKQVNPFNTLNPLPAGADQFGVGLLVPLLAILLIGLMARNIVGRWLLEFGEGTLQRIPLAGSVYKTLKQLLETFLRDNSSRFRRVVLVEYPRQGLYALGFVTGVLGASVQAGFDQPMLSVFIPTAPESHHRLVCGGSGNLRARPGPLGWRMPSARSSRLASLAPMNAKPRPAAVFPACWPSCGLRPDSPVPPNKA